MFNLDQSMINWPITKKNNYEPKNHLPAPAGIHFLVFCKVAVSLSKSIQTMNLY